MAIGIIIGSVREGRLGESVAQWVLEQAQARGGEHAYELVDLKDYPMPLLDAEVLPAAAEGKYADAQVTAWAEAVAKYDGFVMVTPEYNHSVPGPLKNAVDSLFVEWAGKPITVLGYSYSGGQWVIPAWLPVLENLKMKVAENTVSFSIPDNTNDAGLAVTDAVAEQLRVALDEVEAALCGR